MVTWNTDRNNVILYVDEVLGAVLRPICPGCTCHLLMTDYAERLVGVTPAGRPAHKDCGVGAT